MNRGKRAYIAPKVVSQRIFEQAALACSTAPYMWNGSAFCGGTNASLKAIPETCGWHHS